MKRGILTKIFKITASEQSGAFFVPCVLRDDASRVYRSLHVAGGRLQMKCVSGTRDAERTEVRVDKRPR